MKSFKGKVAVITGAASGIGRGIAERCAKEGMKVVLADIEEKSLYETQNAINAKGIPALSVITDVSKLSDIEFLATKSLAAFHSIDLLFNNAGVGVCSTIWESSISDWKWVLGVNLWGVINGIRTFVPIMLKQNTEAHIVNTASMLGFLSGAALGAYKVSKHGVISLSETLYHELKQIDAKINVSVLCPGFINTNILNCERNRPKELQNISIDEIKLKEGKEVRLNHRLVTQAVSEGMSPQRVADYVFSAIREEKFYIFVNPGDFKRQADKRAEDIIYERNPGDPAS